MTVFLLKLIAVLSMICDHMRYVLPVVNTSVTKVLGRIAFPVFAFLISEGCIHTKDRYKYLMRLFIFALISQIPYMLFTYGCNIVSTAELSEKIELNVIFTLLLGAVSISFFDKFENKFLKILSVCVFSAIAYFINTDYGAVGVLIIVAFYIFRDKKYFKNFFVASIFSLEMIVVAIKEAYRFKLIVPFVIGYFLAATILCFYNGKIGKYKLKYLFYIIYPLHLIILFFIYYYIH